MDFTNIVGGITFPPYISYIDEVSDLILSK
jgi:hypothetical protein